MVQIASALPPLIPAKAGTQAFYRRARRIAEKAWAPAFAGVIGIGIEGLSGQ
jgi:hypothetical protein